MENKTYALGLTLDPQLDTEGGPKHESPTFVPSFLGVIRDPETLEGQRILKGPPGFGASCTLLHLCRASLGLGLSQLQPVFPAPCLASGYPNDLGTHPPDRQSSLFMD